LYIPPYLAKTAWTFLHGLIREHSLAALVTLGSGGLLANHIPLIVDPEPAPFGTLRGHMARGNGQWKESRADMMALAIFQGPSAYVTPSWYPSKQEHGRVVPTYNYAVVHAHGYLHIFEDPDILEKHVRILQMFIESVFAEPWSVDDAPQDYVRGLSRESWGLRFLSRGWKGSGNGARNRPPQIRQESRKVLRANRGKAE